MQAYQKEFLDLAIARSVLKFGRFELKSGRISPYFFNAGGFDSGAALATLGRCYAEAIRRAGVDYDVLFGPAYKGIPLVAATAIGLAATDGQDRPYCFNRKEAKDHGEGGSLVGAPLAGRVLVIDDVITAGTAIGESAGIIQAAGATLAGVVIALDRQERGGAELSAVQEVERRWGIPVISIVSLGDVMRYLAAEGRRDLLESMAEYRRQYGVA